MKISKADSIACLSGAGFTVAVLFLVAAIFQPALAHARERAEIVYIGDSHSVGCFGKVLSADLRGELNRATGQLYRVQNTATCGSGSSSWLNPAGNSTTCGFVSCGTNTSCERPKDAHGHSKSLEALLSENQPQVTVVELGTNMLHANVSKTLKEVARLVAEIRDSGSRCIWVGPPQPATTVVTPQYYEDYVAALKEESEVQGCKFIDSSNKTDRRTLNDAMGLHYGCAEASAWARQVYTEIKSRSLLRLN